MPQAFQRSEAALRTGIRTPPPADGGRARHGLIEALHIERLTIDADLVGPSGTEALHDAVEAALAGELRRLQHPRPWAASLPWDGNPAGSAPTLVADIAAQVASSLTSTEERPR